MMFRVKNAVLVTCLLFISALLSTALAQDAPVVPGVGGGGEGDVKIQPDAINKSGIDNVLSPNRLPLNMPTGDPNFNAPKPAVTPTGAGDDGSTEGADETKKDELGEDEAVLLKGRAALPPARIWGQQFFRDKSLDVFTPKRKVLAPDDYVLEAGDDLTINIWGNSDYSGVFTINHDGYIDLRKELVNIPRLYVRNFTYGNAREMIIKHIGRYIDLEGPETQIEIKLNYSRSITINITGEVFTPGSYTITATNTAFNALVASGGPNQIGSVRDVKVFSEGRPPRTLDLYQFLKNPDSKEEFYLRNNDYIFVPLAGKVVDIKGSVKRPFFYELTKNENLLELINYAGGLQPDAYKNNIQIKRFINDEEYLIDVDLNSVIKEKKVVELKDGDVVTISPIESSYTNFVNIDGAVKVPGEYELETGKTKLLDVVKKAGLLVSARTDRVYIIRIKEDLAKEYIRINLDTVLANDSAAANLILRPYDIIRVEPKSKFRNDYVIGVYGAVREPGYYVYSPNLTLKDVVFLSGGLREEAANNRIEISRIVKGRNENTRVIVNTVEIDDNLNMDNDYALEPFDQVFIRTAPEFELQRNVTIGGEVRFPGVYTLIDKNERVLSLLQRAGGPTDGAFLQASKMFRKENKTGQMLLDAARVMDDPNSNYNYILKEGDSIYIPKIRDLVTIKGAVNYPPIDTGTIDKISVPYHPGKNAKFYVDEYGAGVDFSERGRKELIYVTYPSGQIKRTHKTLFFYKYPKVEIGSIVSVGTQKPKKKLPKEGKVPLDWNRFFQTFTAQISAALALYLLINTAIRQ